MMVTEYERYLKERLNLFERMSDSLTGTDERLDYANKLLEQLVAKQPVAISFEPVITMLNAILKQLQELTTAMGGKVIVKLENPSYITAQKVTCSIANVGYQLPTALIPYDFEVAIKALDGNTGTIRIGNTKSDAESESSSFPLAAGEAVAYQIKNLNQLWICATVASDGIAWTVEKDK